jgi:hypothetical protein
VTTSAQRPPSATIPVVPPKLRPEASANAELVPPKPAPVTSAKTELTTAMPQKPDLAIEAEQQKRPSTDTRGVVFPPATKPAAEPRQVPLKDPLPKVDSILIDQERRLAIIDGAVAAVGDPVGPRVIVQIERDAVVLREPSGLLVRIPMRSRQISWNGANRHVADAYIFSMTLIANGRDRA